MTTPAPIGMLARKTGVKVPTIRYYEQIGLLPAPPRTPSNRRHYGAADVARLVFIRHARELGFDLDAIRGLLALQERPEQSCDAVDAIARAHLAVVEDKIVRLGVLKAELQRMLANCARGKIASCQVIGALAGHARSPWKKS